MAESSQSFPPALDSKLRSANQDSVDQEMDQCFPFSESCTNYQLLDNLDFFMCLETWRNLSR